jgi:flagellar protein FliO/FliZ
MGFFDIVQAFLPLLLIVGLLYGVLVFIRKYGVSFKGKQKLSANIKVISTQMLMPKKFISVVKVEDKYLVLGVSEHSITMLKELNSPVAESLELETEETQQNFLEILKRNIGLK